jgi:hypothetical protein
MAKKGQRKRGWVGDAKIGERVGWAMGQGSKRVESEPWAAVVLFQVGVEVGVAAVVHWLTERQEPALAAWIEQARLDTFKRPEELALLNALLAPSGARINDDEVRWSAYMRHVDRRNDFLHQGLPPTSDGARESEEACRWFQERLLDLADATTKKLDAEARRRCAWRSSRLTLEERGQQVAARVRLPRNRPTTTRATRRPIRRRARPRPATRRRSRERCRSDQAASGNGSCVAIASTSSKRAATTKSRLPPRPVL